MRMLSYFVTLLLSVQVVQNSGSVAAQDGTLFPPCVSEVVAQSVVGMSTFGERIQLSKDELVFVSSVDGQSAVCIVRREQDVKEIHVPVSALKAFSSDEYVASHLASLLASGKPTDARHALRTLSAFAESSEVFQTDTIKMLKSEILPLCSSEDGEIKQLSLKAMPRLMNRNEHLNANDSLEFKKVNLSAASAELCVATLKTDPEHDGALRRLQALLKQGENAPGDVFGQGLTVDFNTAKLFVNPLKAAIRDGSLRKNQSLSNFAVERILPYSFDDSELQTWTLDRWKGALASPDSASRMKALDEIQRIRSVPQDVKDSIAFHENSIPREVTFENLIQAQLLLNIDRSNELAMTVVKRGLSSAKMDVKLTARETLLNLINSFVEFPEAMIRENATKEIVSSDPTDRAFAIILFSKLKSDQETAIRGLLQGFTDQAPAVRISAINSSVLVFDERVEKAVVSALSDSVLQVQLAAYSIAKSMRFERHPTPLALDSENSLVRAAALKLVSNIPTQESWNAALDGLNDENTEVRLVALSAIRELSIRMKDLNLSDLNTLKPLLNDQSSQIRRAAIAALVAAERGQITASSEIAMVLQNRDLNWNFERHSLAIPMASFGQGSNGYTMPSKDIVLSPPVSLLLLGKLSTLSPEDIAHRLKIVLDTNDYASFRAAQTAIPELCRLLSHEKQEVRDLASDAIGHILQPMSAAAPGMFSHSIWPPPLWTVRAIIDQLNPALAGQTYRERFDNLKTVLSRHGYTDYAAFALPAGFVMVTRIERIEVDGTPNQSARWTREKLPLRDFSITEWLKRLFIEPPGDFRLFVFVVTPMEVESSGTPLLINVADELLQRGDLSLPNALAETDCRDSKCTSLIYHFRKSPGDPPTVIEAASSSLRAIDHLAKAGLIPPN